MLLDNKTRGAVDGNFSAKFLSFMAERANQPNSGT